MIKREHSCTDVPCLLIFGAFLAAWTGIAVIAVSNGDINKWVLGATYNYINSICIASHILDQTDVIQSSAPENSDGHLFCFYDCAVATISRRALLPTDSSGQVCGRGAMSHRLTYN